ncbi:MAG: hypothetical protein JSS93_03160 [Bacteroidetes bacterium]|nr:hypothetical protein [Bacteroidota bacterium]
MLIKVSKGATKAEIKKALSKFQKKKKPVGFPAAKYFGQLVRGFDGLKYQKEVRSEWN